MQTETSITNIDFFIFLIRNQIDYNDESITNILFNNLIINNENKTILNKHDLKSLLVSKNILFTNDDLTDMIELAEFDNNGNLDHKGIGTFYFTI